MRCRTPIHTDPQFYDVHKNLLQHHEDCPDDFSAHRALSSPLYGHSRDNYNCPWRGLPTGRDGTANPWGRSPNQVLEAQGGWRALPADRPRYQCSLSQKMNGRFSPAVPNRNASRVEGAGPRQNKTAFSPSSCKLNQAADFTIYAEPIHSLTVHSNNN